MTNLERPIPRNITVEHVPAFPVARCVGKIRLTPEDISPTLDWHKDWRRILARQDDYSPSAAAKTFEAQRAALAKDPSADPSEFKSHEEIERQFAAIRDALGAAQIDLQKQAPSRCEALVRKVSAALHRRGDEVEKFEKQLAEDLGIEFEPSRVLKRLRATAERFDESAAKKNGFHPHHMFADLIDFEKGTVAK